MASLEQIATAYVQERITHSGLVRDNLVRDILAARQSLTAIRSDLTDALDAAATLDAADSGNRVAALNAAIGDIDSLATTQIGNVT